MDSEEFAITSSITSQSTLILMGYTAKSWQLNMTSLDIWLMFSSIYVEYAALELKVWLQSYREDL